MVATGNASGAVVNAVTAIAGAVQQISQKMQGSSSEYIIPWIVPVLTKADRAYAMTATISGTSYTTDSGITSPDDDNEASISATLSMCSDDGFDEGGAVDTLEPKMLADPALSDLGTERNLFAGARNYVIQGLSTCDCDAVPKDMDTHVDPNIMCKTHGSMRKKTISFIEVNTVHILYEELPCPYNFTERRKARTRSVRRAKAQSAKGTEQEAVPKTVSKPVGEKKTPAGD